MAGSGIQRFGYFLDDLQYVGEQGLRPILNNLMQIAPALGIVTLAGDQLIRQMGGLDAVMTKMGLSSPLTTEAERMEALGNQTHRTAEEQKKLNEYKQEAQRIDAMMAGKSTQERATAAAVAGAIAEADPNAVVRGLIQNRGGAEGLLAKDEKAAALADLQARRAALQGQLERGELTDQELMSLGAVGAAPGVREQKLASVRQSRMEAIVKLLEEEETLRREMLGRQKKEVQRLMIRAQEDPAALLAEVEKNPGRFPPGFADALRAATPAALEAQAQARLEAQGARQGRLIEQEMERDARARADGIKRALGPMTVEGAIRQTKRDEDMAERYRRHGERMAALMAPEIRQSRVMDASQLNASIQASVTNGPSREEQRLIEVRKEIADFRRDLRNLPQPVK
jgi:DNA-binding ferritin-like protein